MQIIQRMIETANRHRNALFRMESFQTDAASG
jgi:hypothetical protein